VDPRGRPYVGAVLSTVDVGTANEKQSKVEQTLDAYGNLTQRKAYDYGNLTTPARVWDNVYLSTSAYTSRFIRNRMTSSTVTAGGSTVTLATAAYDNYSGGILGNGPLVNRTGLTQHDSTNYGTGFVYRGNVTSSWAAGSVGVWRKYDITGMAVEATDQMSTASTTPTSNNAVPGAITVSGMGTSTMSWNSFLGLTNETGANGQSSSVWYDAYARPNQTSSPHGATTSMTYTSSPATTTATTNGRWVKTTMDGLGRTVKVESGHGTTTVSVVETEYTPCACTPLGKMLRTSLPFAPGATKY
jgi:hypothetical protein